MGELQKENVWNNYKKILFVSIYVLKVFNTGGLGFNGV